MSVKNYPNYITDPTTTSGDMLYRNSNGEIDNISLIAQPSILYHCGSCFIPSWLPVSGTEWIPEWSVGTGEITDVVLDRAEYFQLGHLVIAHVYATSFTLSATTDYISFTVPSGIQCAFTGPDMVGSFFFNRGTFSANPAGIVLPLESTTEFRCYNSGGGGSMLPGSSNSLSTTMIYLTPSVSCGNGCS